MFNTAISTINYYNLLTNGDKVVTALSGGADSMALLFFLQEIKYRFGINVYALHVNHMLRGDEALRDMNFVKDYCHNNNIKLLIYNNNVKELKRDLKISIEEAGRVARQRAYANALHELGANKIAVAHNKNDQAETFLLRLSRGTGTNGLRCMDYKSGNIIRPLLDCGREEIELYVQNNNIPYVTDSTNNEEIYDRNKVRLSLIPWFTDNLNINIINNLANTALLVKEQTDYLNKQALSAYGKCLHKQEGGRVVLNREHFLGLDIAIKKLVIMIAVANVCKSLKDIHSVHINSILEVSNNKTGKKAVLPNKIICERQYDYVVFKKEETPIAINYQLLLNEPVYIYEKRLFILISDNDKFETANFKNLCTKVVNCDKILHSAYVRTRFPGDKIRLRGGTKKLKKYFIDLKIPREERDSTCLIVINDEVVSIINFTDALTEGKYTYYINIWEDTNG